MGGRPRGPGIAEQPRQPAEPPRQPGRRPHSCPSASQGRTSHQSRRHLQPVVSDLLRPRGTRHRVFEALTTVTRKASPLCPGRFPPLRLLIYLPIHMSLVLPCSPRCVIFCVISKCESESAARACRAVPRHRLQGEGGAPAAQEALPPHLRSPPDASHAVNAHSTLRPGPDVGFLGRVKSRGAQDCPLLGDWPHRPRRWPSPGDAGASRGEEAS